MQIGERALIGTTRDHGFGPTVSGEPTSEEFSDGAIAAIAAAHTTSLWIRADDIGRADIQVGILTGRANLRLKDRRRIKLLASF